MKKQAILNLQRALNNCGNLSGAKFTYAIAKNLDKIKPEVEALQKSLDMSEAFQKYEEERVAFAESYAKRNDKDEPLKHTREDGIQEYQIEDQKAFDKELEKLKKKHKPAIDEREKQIDDFNEMLKEESDVELYKVKLEHIPEAITGAQMAGIMPIVEEE